MRRAVVGNAAGIACAHQVRRRAWRVRSAGRGGVPADTAAVVARDRQSRRPGAERRRVRQFRGFPVIDRLGRRHTLRGERGVAQAERRSRAVQGEAIEHLTVQSVVRRSQPGEQKRRVPAARPRHGVPHSTNERSVGKRERSMTVETRCVFVPVMLWTIACRLRRREPGSRRQTNALVRQAGDVCGSAGRTGTRRRAGRSG
jgi:hypothetical protein